MQTTLNWLRARGITDKILSDHGIEWTTDDIRIPIFGNSGAILFRKYRKSPANRSDKPKYWQDKGATAQLYNRHNINNYDYVFICEGELDVLRLEAAGVYAVSSTGGAGTFKEEWVELFEGKNVLCCFDNDQAGLMGMQKLATMFTAGIIMIMLPESVGKSGDVTDFLNAGGDVTKLKGNYWQFNDDDFDDEIRKKESLISLTKKDKISRYRIFLEQIINIQRAVNESRRDPLELKYLYNFINSKKKRLENPPKRKIGGDEVQKAKEFPLTDLYDGELNYRGRTATGLCPFHDDKNPSFVIYPDTNDFWCFSCSAGRDSIDFVMKRDDCSFGQAIKIING